MSEKITVLGCGRWASFHAWYQTVKLGNSVLVWGRAGDPIYEEIARTKKNTYLDMPEDVVYSCDLREAIDYSDIIIIAVTAQAMRELSVKIGGCAPANKTFVLCMKGIDCETGERLSTILRRSVGISNKICVWVGPGHVQELTAGLPNVMLIAGDDKDRTAEIISKFETDLITVFRSDDLIGAEVGAAAKNVMGIAAGFLDGMGMTSLKGALMARGCYEVSLLTQKMGGNKMTAFGMSHLGDFEATLFSANSHNRRYGEDFARGVKNDIGTAEGVATAKAMYNLAKRLGVDMPITDAVYNVLYNGAEPKNELLRLLSSGEYAKEFRYE